MRTLLKVLLGLLALGLGVSLFLPSKTHVQRSITVQAPPAAVFDRVNTYQGFNEFSPWFEKDPQATYVWSGPQHGVGARMTWDSKRSDVGQGSQEIMVSEPYKRVVVQLEFGAPGKNEASWLIDPVENGAKVTWTLDFDAGGNPLARWIGLSLDRFVGADYERGLTKLKAVVERDAAKSSAATPAIETLDVAAMDIASLPGQSGTAPDQAAAALGEAFGTIGAFLRANNLQMSGPPLAITHKYDAKGWVFDAAVPFSGKAPAQLSGPVKIGKSWAGLAAKATHIGPYSGLPKVYEALQAYLAKQGLQPAGEPWEQYINDPGSAPQDKLITYVYWPARKP